MNTKHITEIILHNYRGYKHTVIPMTAGLNVIYGEGDAGKSALEKALGWCLFNEKQGKFINSGIVTPKGKIKSKEEVYVQVTFNTGGIIRRGADSSTVNIYWVGNTDIPFEEWEEPFKNFKDVPKEIQAICNLSSVNIGKQFDSHFLLSSKGSQIAKDLNKRVNLEIIDSSQSNAKHFVNQIKREKEASEFNLVKYEKDLKSYDYLVNMDKALGVVEKIENNIEENKGVQKKVGLLLNDLEEVEEKQEKFKKILTFKSIVEASQELKKKVDLTSNDVKIIKSTLSQLRENKEALGRLPHVLYFKDVISEIVNMEQRKETLREVLTELSVLLEKADIDSRLKTHQKVVEYKKVVESISSLETKISQANKEYDHIVKLLDLIENNAKSIKIKQGEIKKMKENLSGVCPTCGRTFGDCEEAT